MYHGFFINLAASTQRRDAMLAHLAEVGAADRYRRFDAVDGRAVVAGYNTTLKPGELGCWLSAIELLRQNVGSDRHLHVMDDDVVVARNAVPMFDAVLQAIEAHEPDWDVLFTEIFVPPDVLVFRQFAAGLREFREQGRMNLVRLRRWGFAGSTSYFVNKRSIAKMLALLDRGWENNRAIDVHLRSLIWSNTIVACVTCPFLTTLGSLNEQSDIRGALDAPRRVFDLFRSGFFADADVPALLRRLVDLNRDVTLDDMSNLLLQVQLFMLGPNGAMF